MSSRIFQVILLIIISISSTAVTQAQTKTENVILITLDGVRWREIFQGVDKRYFDHPEYILHKRFHENFKKEFWHDDVNERRKILFPFLWNTIATEGQLYGNREKGSNANITNKIHYSYPGYSEILTGVADPVFVDNAKILNKNWSFLEWLEKTQGYKGKTAAFAGWDVFPYIFNRDRNDIFTNFGFEPMEIMLDNPRIKELNQLQLDIPVPWDQVRFDAYTFNFAFEYLKEKRPNVLYISLAETDDYAHDGQYDRYITSAQKSDEFISRLWNWVQNDPEYKDKTTLLITTDHGRGYVELADWKEHGEMDIASDEGDKAIWMAVIGPDTPATGEMKNTTDVKQNQIARTLMKMMGFDYEANHETLKAGNVIEAMMK